MISMAIYWFRNNLRIHDNPSLVDAVRKSEQLLLVYVINQNLLQTHPLGFKTCGIHRWNFLTESVNQLKNNLDQIGIELLIIQGNPVIEITRLAKKYQIRDIFSCKEYGYTDSKAEQELSQNFRLHLYHDQLLIDPDDLPFSIKALPMVFTDFRKAAETTLNIRHEKVAPEKIVTLLTDENPIEIEPQKCEIDARSAYPFAGGESMAWKRLHHYFWQTGKVSAYKNTRNGLIGQDYSGKLSAYLALGCISPVSIFHQIKKYEKTCTKNISTYWFIFELLWREFFKLTCWKYGNDVLEKGGILHEDRVYENDIEKFNGWIHGKTEDDFINANMIELAQTGFMSNRGRQNVASYLVHDLKIDWRWGAAYFESRLIDYDFANNWGNWMYVAGVGNDPRSRRFNTKLQAERYDAKNVYRNMWLGPNQIQEKQ
jgi:deoxyribodipyrimidine photo-lyase